MIDAKKNSKKHGNNLGGILQNWIEQQEIRQIELIKEKKRKKKESRTKIRVISHEAAI